MAVDLKQKLTFVSVRDLLNESFYIPGYQRGYRWQPSQVLALLNDIWDFRTKWMEKRSHSAKYCLQPLVVSERGPHEWEVIDGQQRLTTLFLILQRLDILNEAGQCYSIEYETPYATDAYRLDISLVNPEDSIDSYHLSEAIKTIDNWIKQHFGSAKDQQRKLYMSIADTDEFLTHFIWYNVSDEVRENNNLAIDIFDRLNVGKIGLTNAELIKALFMTALPPDTDPSEVSRFRIRMGQQWDQIEGTLGQPMFWNYICQNPDDYITKIEYLFDILKEKSKDDEPDFTFNCYYQQINERGDKDIVETLWNQINELYQTFCDWYSDKDYYHLIGYLITSGETIKSILDQRFTIINDNKVLQDKESFKLSLIKKAKDTISKVKLEDDELFLRYTNKKNEIRKVLLLFNIFTILQSKDNSLEFMRFPFDKYRAKDEKGRVIWDIEHIHSQTDKEILGKDRPEWIETLMQYFTGEETYEDAKKMLDSEDSFKKYYLDEQTRKVAFDFCTRLESFHEVVSAERRQEFEQLYDNLISYFHEADPDFKIHSLGNLTLLDKGTNRSYRNAFFPVKRMIIMRKAKEGVFIPLCTQNIFLKAYSKVFGNLTSWTSKDSVDYLQTIIDTLK